eukprot:scaffold447_cov307-Pinguiococcus_pyrenoidosus.AAC.50
MAEVPRTAVQLRRAHREAERRQRRAGAASLSPLQLPRCHRRPRGSRRRDGAQRLRRHEVGLRDAPPAEAQPQRVVGGVDAEVQVQLAHAAVVDLHRGDEEGRQSAGTPQKMLRHQWKSLAGAAGDLAMHGLSKEAHASPAVATAAVF